MNARRTLCMAGLAAMLLPVDRGLAAAPDDSAVRSVLRSQFDRPDAPLGVPVVATAGHHAVASWQQGERGGRALLRRSDGAWRIVACGGDALVQVNALREAGLSSADAQALRRDLLAGEARLSAADRARFASFGATARMDGAGGHPAR